MAQEQFIKPLSLEFIIAAVIALLNFALDQADIHIMLVSWLSIGACIALLVDGLRRTEWAVRVGKKSLRFLSACTAILVVFGVFGVYLGLHNRSGADQKEPQQDSVGQTLTPPSPQPTPPEITAQIRKKGAEAAPPSSSHPPESKPRTGEPDSKHEKKPAKKPDEELTLHYLFKHDFDNTLRLSQQISVTEKTTGKIVTFEAQAYLDHPARSEFVGVYLPYTTSDDTFIKCQLFSDSYKELLDHPTTESTAGMVGEEMMSSKDLLFSGRVFIYHENTLSLEQRASLDALYKSKKLSVQFRGFGYLSGRLLAQQKP
jgi:hypothetical protein